MVIRACWINEGELQMTKITENAKARRITEGLSKLEAEYLLAGETRDLRLAGAIHLANVNLPPDSKARLYDILTEAN